MIDFTCDQCDKSLKAPPSYAGKKARCTECRAILVVPNPTTDTRVAAAHAPLKRADLPLGAQRLLSRLRARIPWAVAPLLIGLAIGLSFMQFGEFSAVLGWIIAGSLWFVTLPTFFWICLEYQRVAWRLSAFQRGKYLAHWVSTEEESKAADPEWTPELAPGESFIGYHGGYYAGQFLEWDAFNNELYSVDFVKGPPAVLIFTVRVHAVDGTFSAIQLNIPVPPGKEKEARRILKTLITRGFAGAPLWIESLQAIYVVGCIFGVLLTIGIRFLR